MVRKITTCCLFSLFSIIATAQTYDEMVSKAMNAVRGDSLILAERYFQDALKMDPINVRNSLLFTNLGTVQRRLEKYTEAIESYSMAINITPYSVVALLNRASLYLEQNFQDKAYVDYCNVLDIDKDNKEALLYRAYIYVNKRKYAEARADYTKLLNLDPSNKMARMGKAMLDEKELRFREASDELTRLITEYPNDVNLYKLRANIASVLGNMDLALLDLETAIKIDSQDAELFLMCGEIYLAQKHKREAGMAFERAVELGIPRAQVMDKLKASKK